MTQLDCKTHNCTAIYHASYSGMLNYDEFTNRQDGFCQTGPEDEGKHTVCVRVTAEFLEFSKSKGNDLSTPYPMYGFPGLKPDDCWCLCAGRWKEAFLAGYAPLVVLSATHAKALEVVTLEQLVLLASGDNTSEDEMQ